MDHLNSLRDVERLEALKRTGLMDSLPEPAFDRFARLASRITGSPTALISLVDDQRQFFKAAHGLGEPLATERGTPLSHSFCQYVASSGQTLVVEDARSHGLVQDSPAIQDLNVIAYLGSPIRAQGRCIGSVCVVDRQPRRWRATDREALEDLADCVNSEIELRLTSRLSEVLPAMIYLYDEATGQVLFANQQARLHNLSPLCTAESGEVQLDDQRFLHRWVAFQPGQRLGLAISTD